MTGKLQKQYKMPFEEALDKFNEENAVEFSNSPSRKGYTEVKFKNVFVRDGKLLTNEEATTLFQGIKADSSATGAVVTGKQIYEFLAKNVEVVKEDPKPATKGPQKQEEFKSITEKLEKRIGEFLPAIFRKMPAPKVMQEKHLNQYLKVYFNKDNCSSSELKELSEEIMDGRDDLKVKELYFSIKEHTTYESKTKDCQKTLEQLIKESVNEKAKANAKDSKKPEFNTDKDKDYTAAIFSIDNKEPNDRYIKYDLLDEFYSNSDQYKEYAKSIVKGAKKVSDDPKKPKDEKKPTEEVKPATGGFAALGLKKPETTPTDPTPDAGGIKEFTIGNQKADEGGFSDDNEEEKEDPAEKKNKFSLIFGGNKGAEPHRAPMATDEKDLLHKLKDIDFSQLKAPSAEPKSPDGRRQSMRISNEEVKEFNALISGFIKGFNKIADKKVVTSALKVMRSFLFEHNGSKQFQNQRERTGQANFDVNQFWKGTANLLKGIEFATDFEKYVWCFVELEVESFTVSTSALEKLIQTTTKKNLDYRADEIIKKLNVVYKEIVAMSTNDPDKSVEIEYTAKVSIYDLSF